MITKRERQLSKAMIVVQVIITLLIFISVAAFFPEKVFSKKVTLALLLQIVAIWGYLFYKFRLGVVFRFRNFASRFRGYLVTVSVGCTLLLLEMELIPYVRHSELTLQYLTLFYVLDLATLVIFKIGFYVAMRFARRKGHNTRNLVIIADHTSEPFIDFFIQARDWGYRIVSIISPETDFGGKYERTCIITSQAMLKDYITANPVDDIFYCLPIEDKRYDLQQVIKDTEETGVSLHIMQQSFLNTLVGNSKINGYDNSFVTYSKVPPNYLALKMKDALDFIFGVIVLVLALPVMLAIALLIKLEDGGPALFKQERIGLNGRRFRFYKFRTMVTNAEELKESLLKSNEADGPVFKMENDPRITRVGRFLRKTSLDELPQFYNVLKGDMSVVGPRPPLLKEVLQYERSQLRRLSMKPGITCSWQVWGRHDVTFEEWMKMDLDYIDHWSHGLDMKIAFATIGVILKANGQ